MRFALVFLIGLAVGALGMSQIGKVLAARDAYPRGVMAVMQQHYGALRRALDQNQCVAANNSANLLWMTRMSEQIEPALNPGDVDPRFHAYARKLDARLAAARALNPASCPALRVAARQIGARCAACHAVYR